MTDLKETLKAADVEAAILADTLTPAEIAGTIKGGRTPREKGFNYGTGNTAPTPEVYEQVATLARSLGETATAASKSAWRTEQALRAWRLAETDTERADALATLETLAANPTTGRYTVGDTKAHLTDRL